MTFVRKIAKSVTYCYLLLISAYYLFVYFRKLISQLNYPWFRLGTIFNTGFNVMRKKAHCQSDIQRYVQNLLLDIQNQITKPNMTITIGKQKLHYTVLLYLALKTTCIPLNRVSMKRRSGCCVKPSSVKLLHGVMVRTGQILFIYVFFRIMTLNYEMPC